MSILSTTWDGSDELMLAALQSNPLVRGIEKVQNKQASGTAITINEDISSFGLEKIGGNTIEIGIPEVDGWDLFANNTIIFNYSLQKLVNSELYANQLNIGIICGPALVKNCCIVASMMRLSNLCKFEDCRIRTNEIRFYSPDIFEQLDSFSKVYGIKLVSLPPDKGRKRRNGDKWVGYRAFINKTGEPIDMRNRLDVPKLLEKLGIPIKKIQWERGAGTISFIDNATWLTISYGTATWSKRD